MRKGFLCLFLILFLIAFDIPLIRPREVNNGNISFQPNSIPDVNVYYDNYDFVFEYKSFFIRIRPFVIYNETYYGMKQIVTWIKNNYPNVNYKWLVDKAVNAIHYGFNLTKLPQNIADKIDYLGFRLMDLNFPLSWFKLEEIEIVGEEVYNFTRIHIPKANLVFSFEDLYPYGYSIEHINSTYILIGNVKGKMDLIIDPITFSGGIITVTGYTEGSPATFWDLWNASNVNAWNVSEKTDSSENTQFAFGCRIQIGTGSATWFADENIQVIFNSTALSGNSQSLIEVKNNAHFRVGQILDATDKLSYKGCQFIALDSYLYISWVKNNVGGEVEIYSSSFIQVDKTEYRDHSFYNLDSTEMPFWNNLLEHSNFLGVWDISHVIMQYGSYQIGYKTTGDFRDSYLFKGYHAFYFHSTYGNAPIKNVIVRQRRYRTFRVTSLTIDKYVVNFDVDTWDFFWIGTSTGEIYRQYEFDLNTTFANATAIQNANVTLSYYGEGGGTIGSWLTFANGTIPTQTLNMGFYNATGGDTLYNYNPYKLTIILNGYQTYTKNFTLEEKTDWRIALQETTGGANLYVMAPFFFLGLIIALVIGLAYSKHS